MFVHEERLRKADEYRAARSLRRIEGMPYKQIAAKLGVSPGSVYRWTRDIELTPEQRKRNMGRGRLGQPPWILTQGRMRQARLRRRGYQQEGRLKARDGDALHQAGCMLYWAEGAKDRNTLCFANSDINMLRLFARFLRESLGVNAEEFRIRLNVYTNGRLSLREIEDRWLPALEAPRSSLRGHTLNYLPTSSSGKKRSLPYGVCSLKVARSTRLVQHIYGAIQEYAGFDEPKWLDGPPRRRRKPRKVTPAGS